jgi:hypothetical protein
MIRRIRLLLLAVLSVALLALGNLFALGTMAIFAEEAEGFVAFVNAIGILALTSVGVGVVIAWRVRSNPIPWLLIAGALMLQGVFVSWPLLVLAAASAALPELALGVIAWWGNVSLVPALFMLFPMVGLLFPDGSLPSPRWRVPLAILLAVLGTGIVLATIAPWGVSSNQPIANPFALPGIPSVVSEIGGAMAAVAAFAGFGLAVGGTIVRFRRSRGVERAQMKWLLAAVALMSIVFPISFATDVGPADLIDLASVLVGSLVPLAIGVAILRYRLYDIDRLISRTVSWALVTGVLIAIFAGLVVGLQAALADLTQGATLAVAASTLVAFALFQPVRRRIQVVVDRRFDRARYDAERTAAAFAERLRDRVDMVGLEADIATTIESAIRPSAVGVWMRPRTDERRGA